MKVEPLKSGRGLLDLTFHHENYPEGVQIKQYQLQVIGHDSTFLFGVRRVQAWADRYLLVTELTWSWLTKHFGLPEQDFDVQGWRMDDRHGAERRN